MGFPYKIQTTSRSIQFVPIFLPRGWSSRSVNLTAHFYSLAKLGCMELYLHAPILGPALVLKNVAQFYLFWYPSGSNKLTKTQEALLTDQWQWYISVILITCNHWFTSVGECSCPEFESLSETLPWNILLSIFPVVSHSFEKATKMQGLFLRAEILIVGLKIYSFYVNFLQMIWSKEKYTSEEAMKAQRDGKCVATLFHYSGR